MRLENSKELGIVIAVRKSMEKKQKRKEKSKKPTEHRLIIVVDGGLVQRVCTDSKDKFRISVLDNDVSEILDETTAEELRRNDWLEQEMFDKNMIDVL